jgi:hypothetical protein
LLILITFGDYKERIESPVMKNELKAVVPMTEKMPRLVDHY